MNILVGENIRSFEHFTDLQGLAQNNINAILQDKSGFIWIGTDDGLSRFDAYTFKNFYQEQGKNGLKSGSIRALHQTEDGKIYIGTIKSGLQYYDPIRGEFNSLDSNKDYRNLKLGNKDIRCLASTKMFLFIGTIGAGLYALNLTNGEIRKVNLSGEKSKNILCLLYNDGRKLICGTEGDGIYVIDIGSKFKINKLQGRKDGLSNDTITSITNSNYKEYLLGTAGGGILKLSLRGGKERIESTKHFGIFEDYIAGVVIRNGKWYIANFSGEGLMEYNPKTKEVIKYKNNPLFTGSISSDNLSCIYLDASSKIWIGTAGTGIDALNPDYAIFNYLNIPNSDIRGIYVFDKNQLLISTYGEGLIVYEKGRIVKNFKNSFEGSNKLSSNYLQSIYPVEGSKYLIGSWEGLNLLDIKSGINKEFIPYVSNGEGRKPAVTEVLKIKENTYLAVISLDGIYYLSEFNLITGKFNDFIKNLDIKKIISENQISFLISNSKYIFIGTRGSGVIVHELGTNIYEVFKKNPSDIYTISGNDVLSGFIDSKKRIWFGVAGGGLNLMDFKSKRFISFTAKDGIPGRNINSIMEDNSGNIWLGSNKGIIYLDGNIDFNPFFLNKYSGNNRKDLKSNPNTSFYSKTYGTESGLSNLNFNQGSIYCSDDNKIYIGSVSNLVSFTPATFKVNSFKPNVAITDFQLFNNIVNPMDSTKILLNDINYTKEINLKYNQNFFGFNFTSLNFINPEKNKFAYRLKNFDQNWIYTDYKRRYASYTGIEPGRYVFELKASNNDGTWSKSNIEIVIKISPPFWQTWWFRISVVLILGTSTFFAIKFRLQQIEKKAREKAEVEKKLSDAKLIALRAQMNPHFLFNSLNSIQQYIYNNDKEQAANYLSKFAKLIRQILQNSSQNNIILEDEIDMLSLYLELEAMRFQNKFEFEFIVDDDVEPEFMEIPTMLIQPFLENSILHGLATKDGTGLLTITLNDIGNKTLEVIIEDDGIGRDKAKLIKKQKLYKYKSMGMEVTNDRLDIINKTQGKNIAVEIIDLRDENGEGTGTKVKVLIPYEDV